MSRSDEMKSKYAGYKTVPEQVYEKYPAKGEFIEKVNMEVKQAESKKLQQQQQESRSKGRREKI